MRGNKKGESYYSPEIPDRDKGLKGIRWVTLLTLSQVIDAGSHVEYLQNITRLENNIGDSVS